MSQLAAELNSRHDWSYHIGLPYQILTYYYNLVCLRLLPMTDHCVGGIKFSPDVKLVDIESYADPEYLAAYADVVKEDSYF